MQTKKRLQLLQLHQVAPPPKRQSSVYKQFLEEQTQIQKKKYPNRSDEEITKLVNLLWKVKEVSQTPQLVYYQNNGFVKINDEERVPVPQPPPPVLIIFQKNMRKLLELTHPEYNGEQVDRTIKFEWTSNTIQRQKASEEYRILRQEFEKEKKEFIIRYGFWPRHKKPNETDQILTDNPLAQMLTKKVKL